MIANGNFQSLSETYLFAEVGRRIRDYKARHPEVEIIRMDIGDVTLPVIPPVVEAMKRAAAETGVRETFRGYGPEQGYDFLRKAISLHDYGARGVEIDPDEIFISDGAKCDIGNLTDLFDPETIVGIPNPVYPVYVDSNIMAGRTVENGRLVYIPCDAERGFRPIVPQKKLDVMYLCSPNNPTGNVMTADDLRGWVEYALAHNALIVFDSAYEAFVRQDGIPRSIYEVAGAKKVAIEVRSFSKTAGFTGLRCGYTVVPRELTARYPDGTEVKLRKLWLRRQTTKFNGASYVVQRGAEALYTPEARGPIKEHIDYYLRNAQVLADAFRKMGFTTPEKLNSPYIWIRDKGGRSSWELFDLLLSECNISTTPGSGFGSAGEGCVRLTGFNTFENTKTAARRLEEYFLR